MSFSPSFAVPPSTPPAPTSVQLDHQPPSSTSSSIHHGGQTSGASGPGETSQDQQQPKPSPLALNMAAVSPPTPAPSPRPSEPAGLGAVTFYKTLGGRSVEDSQTAHLLSIFSQLPPAARTNLLQSLLPLLTTPELLLLSSGISPRLKRDFLRDLPLEISLHILSFVDSPRTLARASCVSRFWRRLLEDEWTWKEMCARHRFAATLTTASASNSPGGTLSSVPPMLDDETVVQEDNEDLTMFGSPRLGIQAPGAPRMAIGGINSPAAFPQPPFLSHMLDPTSESPSPVVPTSSSSMEDVSAAGTDEAAATAVAGGSLSVGASPLSSNHRLPTSSAHVTFSSLPDFFRSPSGTGHSAAAIAVREALEAPSPASFLAYALSSVHAPAGIANQFPFATGDEDDSVMSDGDQSSSSPTPSHGVANQQAGGMPILSPSSFLASLTNTLGLPYGAPAPATLTTAAPPPQMTHGESSPTAQPHAATRMFLPRGLGLAPFPARTVSLGAGSTSSPLAGSSSFDEEGRQVGSMAAKSKGKGKARRRMSDGAGGPAEDDDDEARFSYKRHFKLAYLTESNWLRGGRLLSTHTSTDDGVVTSLAVDDKYIVIGMANCKIHVFDAATGTFLRTLVGHELGVWCLTLISAGGERKEAPQPKDADDVDMDGGYARDPLFGRSGAASVSSRAKTHHRRRSSDGTTTPATAGGAREPVLVGGADSPFSNAPHGLFGGLADLSGNNPAASSTTSLPPSFDSHFHASASRSDGRPKVAQSDVCGASKGFGQSRSLIVSGGCDRDVRVWDAETGACLHILRGHTSTIRCLKVLEGRPLVVSGSRDSSLRVWDVEKGVLVHVLAGHQHSVRCIEVAGNQVVSGSYDCTCRLWDVDTGECLQVFRGHYHQIYSVAFDGERVATGSLDSTVRVWSAETGDCLALLQGHTSLVGQLQLTNDLLVTGGSDGRVIIFSLSTFECLHRLCAHDNSVTCLQFDDRFIVSGGNDGRVKLWDLRSGAFIRELSKPCEAVWRVSFKDDKCVVLCKRGGKTVMEVLTFRPPEEDL